MLQKLSRKLTLTAPRRVQTIALQVTSRKSAPEEENITVHNTDFFWTRITGSGVSRCEWWW